MKTKIERISSDEDFSGVYKLFDGRKSIEELKWVFMDPDNHSSYNAFIAKTKENEVIGVIGYQPAVFKQGDKELIGAIPYNWKISPDHKGIHAMILFKKVFNHGDFVYAIGGSKTSLKLLPLFKLKEISEFNKSYKFLSLFNLKRSRKNDVKLTAYKKGDLVFKEHDKVFEKNLTHNYIDWLLNCPVLDSSYAFNIMDGETHLGVCVLYINKFKKMTIGKIAYLPFLGNDVELWLDVIEKCLKFFKKNKCVVVSAMGHHQMNQLAFKKAGFIGNKLIKRGIFYCPVNKEIESIDFKSWHIQFSEGDQVYLGHNL